MQKLILAGRVGKNAELRRTQAGTPVLGFSIAVDNGKHQDGNKRAPTWFDCSLWGKRAESLEQYITKGMAIVVEGRPTSRAHDGKSYIGCNVSDLSFMGGGRADGRSDGGSGQGGDSQGGHGGGYDSGPQGGYGGGNIDDSEIPF